MTSQKPIDETSLDSHFAFGRNWATFAEHINHDRLQAARKELTDLLGRESFEGESWIDIGCGSGLHSVAAASLGARVLAIDLDPHSVETAERITQRFGMQERIEAKTMSVFDLEGSARRFDVVYSWGVLHHTGDMARAIKIAASLVGEAPDTDLVLALYRRTRLCGFWRLEKRWYTSRGVRAQMMVQRFFKLLYGLSLLVQGRSFKGFKQGYQSRRGMDYQTDVHDWLGGYPYESIVHEDFVGSLKELGFFVKTQVVRYPGRTPSGLFGSGCDEYVFRPGQTRS